MVWRTAITQERAVFLLAACKLLYLIEFVNMHSSID